MKQIASIRRGLALVLPTVLLSALAATLTAQEPKPAAVPTPTVSHRVPSYFGQVDLSPEQRAKIYALQDAQQPAIDRLKQQQDAARTKLIADSEAVLTVEQREKLKGLRTEAKAKSLARSKARAKAKDVGESSAVKKTG